MPETIPLTTSGLVDSPSQFLRARKACKYALVRLLGGRLEQLMFYWRLGVMRVKTVLGRPYTALYDMDRKLEKYLGFGAGVFIEAGANDGLAQSNTYFLEKMRGWTGLLVEPVPKYYRMCARARTARTVNCALGPREKEGGELEIMAGGLMSVATSVEERFLHGRSIGDHAAFGAREFGAGAPEVVRTPIRALSSLLDEAGICTVDFFSLDVEGFELEVLKGLDLARHRPRFMLIETQRPEEVAEFLGSRYELVESLSHHDFLFRSTGLPA
jgi:FkbM family methyltransferase